MTENVRKRSSKWDVVQETSIPTDKHYSSEENQDTNHDKTSNLGLSDSKNCTGQDVKCSVAGPKDTMVSNNSGWSNWDLQSTNHDKTSNLEFGGSKICNGQEYKWSDGGPKDTTVSNNSGWSSWDLQSTNHDKTSNRELGDSKICISQDPKWSDIGPKDTTTSNDSGWPSWDLQSTNHDKASNWELGDSKICNSQDLKWSDGGPKDITVSNNSGWSSWNLQSTNHARKNNTESRDGHDISSTMKTSAGYRSMSPGINAWRQSHSRSPKRGWSKSCRSRSRSSSRSFNHENDVWNNRRGNQGRFLHPETSDHGDGSHSNSGPTENRVSRRESGWSTGQVDNDMFSDFHGERSYSRDWPFHGERKRQDLESDKRILCFNFKKGRCGRGSTCKYAHHGGSTEDPEGEKRNPCFNFMEGRCVRGSTCKYSHHGGSTGGYGAWQANEITKEKTQDGNGSVLPSENHQRHASRRHNNRELPLCKFFAEGCCRKGASCLFPHLASENENHSLRSTDDQWGQRANNGNNLRGACNSEQADTEMENAPESPKWRYDNGRRVDISDSQKFLDRNRDQHAYCMDVEESRLNHKVLPPWNPPQTYRTLPSKTVECPFPGGKQDTTIQVPNSHQLVSNSYVIMTGNADGINFSASRLPSIVTGSAPGFNLNELPYQMGLQAPSNPELIQMGMGEQPHQMGPQAPPNPQFPIQMGMGDAITKPDTKGSNSIQIAAEAAIAQNLVTSEQVSQVENISASLAHIFATGQQLPQLYASLNPRPAAGLMPSHAFSHPKFARPLKLMGVQLVHPNQGSLPQSKQCDPISDSFEPSIPPGYELDMNKPQNVSAEESLEPAKILVPLPRTPEYDDADPKRNCETKENGNFNNENHHLGNPVMSRDRKAKEINAVGGKGEAGQETYSSKGTIANDGQHEEDSMKNKEAKGLKLFKFALVEFVKEMLKPTWREGQISKEAHKTIVKKVVDKVTGTLQGPQIPQTQEKIDHYLVFSKAKLERLVQGYVEKYMKA